MYKIKELQSQIKDLKHKRNDFYKLYNFLKDSHEKKIIRKQIFEFSKFIRSKKAEIKMIKKESILNILAEQIERKIARNRMFI